MSNIVKIEPYQYIHILDGNKNTERVEIGPQTLVLQDHEKITSGGAPKAMISLKPYTYCEVKNPVIKGEDGSLQYNGTQLKVKHGDSEFRTEFDYSEPFPLYPEEKLLKIADIDIIPRDGAARLRCLRDFTDGEVDRKAGDEWLIAGPKTYLPRVEAKITQILASETIAHNEGIKVKARRACKDQEGNERRDGEEWMVTQKGLYLPGLEEEIVERVGAYILNETIALHLIANQSFTDVYGVERKAGQEWLITYEKTSSHIVDVHETLVAVVEQQTLNSDQFCYISD